MANTGLVIDYTIKPNEIIGLQFFGRYYKNGMPLVLFKCLGTVKSGIVGPDDKRDYIPNDLSDDGDVLLYIDLSNIVNDLGIGNTSGNGKLTENLIREVRRFDVIEINKTTRQEKTYLSQNFQIIYIEHQCYESLQGAHPCRILLRAVELSGGSKHRRSKTRRQRSKTRRQRKNKRSTRRRQRKLVKSS